MNGAAFMASMFPDPGQRAFFQDPDTGADMVLRIESGRARVALCDHESETDENRECARRWTELVRECTAFDEAACILSKWVPDLAAEGWDR